jgi:hypothetical protein
MHCSAAGKKSNEDWDSSWPACTCALPQVGSGLGNLKSIAVTAARDPRRSRRPDRAHQLLQ